MSPAQGEWSQGVEMVDQALFLRVLSEFARTLVAEAVKPFETTSQRFVCMSASGVGSLIQAAVGSRGGVGGFAKRVGLAA
jgi:hypothetical protein